MIFVRQQETCAAKLTEVHAGPGNKKLKTTLAQVIHELPKPVSKMTF